MQQDPYFAGDLCPMSRDERIAAIVLDHLANTTFPDEEACPQQPTLQMPTGSRGVAFAYINSVGGLVWNLATDMPLGFIR